MPTLSPLPEQVLAGAHPRAALLASGLTEADLQGPTWSRLSYGMYSWDATAPDLRGQLLRVGSLVPPGGALGGWAAAYLYGAIDLDGTTDSGVQLPVVVCAGRHETCRRGGEQVVIWRSDLADDDVIQLDGVPITAPKRSGFDISRLSPFTGKAGRSTQDAEEALVLFDALLRTGMVTTQDVAAYGAGHPRRAGMRQSRLVLGNADEATRSCQETRFRRLWMVAAELPRPLVNQPIADLEGRFVAEADLMDPDAGLVGEYDGAHHSGAARRSADHVRAESLDALGLTVVRVTAPDLTQFRARTVHRLRT
ncbi:MAG TPA: hypothetical protein VHN80_26550, partial [Kineosporiaceae bacterium]|nr:hypothetical protein [Kineosporiaceae bacterium]